MIFQIKMKWGFCFPTSLKLYNFKRFPKLFLKSRYCTTNVNPSENKLFHYLKSKILATGPITVAEYMKEVLLNPFAGYYMKHDIFGSQGDFITSPEISQMFGELIAVWFYHEWSRLNKPSPFQLVEFGPGRGTLSDDILRVFSKFVIEKDILSLHLVEVSPHLRQMQKSKLCGVNKEISDNELITKFGFPVTWHTDLSTVPNRFTLFLAHEFFDALPVHKFQKTDHGWREVLIDFNRTESLKLEFVIAPGPTPASKLFTNLSENRSNVEISLQSAIIMKDIAKRMTQFGGIALIVDYGYTNGEKSDTFRSFKNHKLHDPLSEPGSADLTADVDFSFLMKEAGDDVVAVGPVSQATFLKNMGIDFRLETLEKTASAAQKKSLHSGFKMLTAREEMGERYKFVSFFPAVLKDFFEKYPPSGFS